MTSTEHSYEYDMLGERGLRIERERDELRASKTGAEIDQAQMVQVRNILGGVGRT